MTLKEARKLIDWSVADLARESGQSVSTIRDLDEELNGRPAYILVMAVIYALRRGGLRTIDPESIFPIPEDVKRGAA